MAGARGEAGPKLKRSDEVDMTLSSFAVVPREDSEVLSLHSIGQRLRNEGAVPLGVDLARDIFLNNAQISKRLRLTLDLVR